MDLVFLVVLFTIAWLITKCCLFILSIKFKLNINFTFNRNHLKNVSISKLCQDPIDTTGFELKIGKIWISSCFVNRNVSERLLICSSNISVKWRNSVKKSTSTRPKIPWFVTLYLNFFGSLSLENIKIALSDQHFTINQLKVERKSKSFFRLILDDFDCQSGQNELVGNKILVTSSPDFRSIELEADKANANFSLAKYINELDGLKSANSSTRWLGCIKSIRVNKLTLNKRHVLNHLEVYSTNLDYLKINLTCLNDLMLSKSTRLVDNLLIEVFNSGFTHDLVFKCDQTNIYYYLDEMEHFLAKIQKVFQSRNGQKISKNFRLEFKLNNFYISLIDRIQTDIYVLGCLFIDLNTNLKSLFKFECENFVLFKSSKKPKDKYSNNLFCQSNDLIKLFQWINYKKFKYAGAKRQYEHVWGNIINCNFVKFRLKLTNSKRKIINTFADQLYIEHSSQLLDQIISFVSSLNKTNESKRQTIFNLRLNQANLIYLFEKKIFLHFSVEDLAAKKHGQWDAFAKSFSCFHNKLTQLGQNESQYSMNQNTINHLKENEKTDLIFLFKSMSLNGLDANYSISMTDVLITWSLKCHFILDQIVLKPIQKCSHLLKAHSDHDRPHFTLKVLVETNILLNFLFDYGQDSSKRSSLKDKDSESYRYFNSNLKLIDTLSLTLNNFYYFYTKNKFNLNIDKVSAFVNTHDHILLYSAANQESHGRTFLQANKISIYTDDQSDYLANERQNVSCKILKNKILFSKFELVHLVFLFEYDFAKMIDHILNVRKVLYKIHQVAPKQMVLSAEGPLSVDFVLSVKQLRLVIEDDPFEVKLSYNYSLIADEYMESLKRRQSLDQRRSIRENNLESQALEILMQRESKIYIQRSKMVYSSLPRIELFCISAENLQLKALSDWKWHGRQKCYEILRKIDHGSPPPGQLDHDQSSSNPALNYLILWCRHINLSIQDFKFLFRDYTQPFLKINSANFFGKFLGSEYQVPFRSRRQVNICVSSELSELDYCCFEIERYMSPFKFYHDLSSKMAVLQYAYGPCWEGCMAQLNLSLEKIIHPARDPSKPLPWWDKSRLYLHGRLSACVQQCHIIYHVSMDPYNRTEEMKLVWSPLHFDWKNMQLSLDGGLDIYLNTESKYDDCLLLHLPSLKAKINIEWLCKTHIFNKANEPRTNNNGHNLVILHAPDKLPQIVNSFEHDSYSHFRSEGLNLFFSFQCHLDSNDVPTCKFYASTSRFLEKIKNLLSATTRPTKRGNLFGNVRPRKTILSRHFRRVSFKFDLPRINVIYWSSASEQYGIQMDSENFLMNSCLKLDLVPFADKLKRRARPNWSIELMKFSVKQTSIDLMSPGGANCEKAANQSETDPFMLEMNERSIKFLDSKPAVRNFFMKIDCIEYEREKSCHCSFYPRLGNESANDTLTNMSMSSLVPIQITNCPKHNLSIRNLKAKWNTVNRDVVYILFEIYNKSNRLRQNLSAHILKQYDLFTDQLLHNHILSQYKNQQKLSRKSSEMSNGQACEQSQVGKSGESHLEELLNKLDSEKNLNSHVFCGDTPLNQSNLHFDNLIYGFHSMNRMGDIVSENVSIQLINSQIKLSLDDSWHSDESFLSFIPKPKRVPSSDKQQEYVIISAARANVVQHLHKPVWKSQRCLEKISWSGHLENMQYFATLNNTNTDSEYWLSEELIHPPKDLPQNYLIEDGSQTKESRLQLIVPKCHCEFYLIGFYDKIPDDNSCIQNTASTFNLSSLLSPHHSEPTGSQNCHQYLLDLNPSFNEPIDCFTLVHHDISLACNSAQYKLFMDLVNNLVLYFRPRRKQIIERQKAVKFNLELSMGNLDSLKSYIQMKQIETKNLLCNLRSLEKQVFYLKEKIENEVSEYNAKFGHLQTPQGPFYVIQELKLENKNLEKQYKECKKFLSELSDELNVLISCYKEMMVEKRAFNLAQTPMFVQYVMDNEKQSNSPWLLLPSGNKFSDLIDLDQLAQKSILNSEIPKRYEIWFKNTKWKLNDDLGQSGLAKFLMKNFLYTKVMNQQELDCVEHNLEIESCKLQDLDPGQTKNKVGKVYEDVLSSLFDYSQAESSCNFSDSNLNNSSSTSGSASMSNSVSSSVSSLSFYENSLNTVQNSTMVRIYCKERPPVGIPVIEHLELNVSPLKINLTNRFFKTMIKYFFENEINSPNNGARTQISEETDSLEKFVQENFLPESYQSTNVPQNNQNTNHLRVSGNQVTENSMLPKVHSPAGLKNILGHHKRPSQSSLKGNNIIMSSPNILISNSSNSINPNRNKNNDNNSNIHLHDDDIEIMKQRSANNNTFLCIKIPEIQLLVTYKGSCLDKKNIKDLNNVCLLFPLFEVHDQTWTWLDLINALKSHVKKALLSQAIKHKLIKIPIQPVNNLINRNRRSNSQHQLTDSQIEEHEKMKFLKLFGTKFIEKKSLPSTPSNINTKKPENDTKIDSEQTSPVSIKKKSMVSKSKSSIGFGFKKHFSRLNKEKVDPNAKSSDFSILSLSDNILNNSINENDS